jgi:hypothetical protein
VERGRDRAERRGARAVARLGRQHCRVPEDAVCGLPGIDVTHAREPTTIGRSLQEWCAAARTARACMPECFSLWRDGGRVDRSFAAAARS